jgi:predicted metal-binding membrane protein
MMAAMMLPAVSPTVALYARMTRRRGPGRPLAFTSGYLVVWGVAGVGAYALYALGRHVLGTQLAWHAGGRWLAGGVIAVAALYELTPLKDACLGKCRSPLGFLIGTWRDGLGGAFSMGSRHAAWCVGCCWALMAALFALGVMSIFWMAVVAGLITIEKTLPWRRVAVWSTMLLLLALAVGVLAAPGSIPGFVVPGGAMAGM